MKPLFPLLCLLLATAPAFAQMQPTILTKAEMAAGAIAEGKEMREPFKGANTILIHTPDSAGRALVIFARSLQANGVAVERLDKELLSISTKNVLLTRAAYASEASYLVTASQGPQSVLVIKGQVVGEVLNTKVVFPAAFKGAEVGTPKAAFRLMERAAVAYPLGKVSDAFRP